MSLLLSLSLIPGLHPGLPSYDTSGISIALKLAVDGLGLLRTLSSSENANRLPGE